MTAGARWTQEQYAAHLARAGRASEAAIHPAAKPGNPARRQRSPDRLESVALLLFQITSVGLPHPDLEYRFHHTRKWRADMAWPESRLLIEYEGGIWNQGAHVRGKHFESDCEKYNAAALLGYTVLRFTYDMVESGEAVRTILQAYELAQETGSVQEQPE